MSTVLVCGGREYKDRRRVFEELDNVHQQLDSGITLVVEGGASGADRLAYEWAEARQLPVVTHFANWAEFGPKAGPIRNREMLDRWRPSLVLAFPGGAGTKNMTKQASARGVMVHAFA